MNEWNDFPTCVPPENKKPVWYSITLENGFVDIACWWLGDWYCYSNTPVEIVKWKEI